MPISSYLPVALHSVLSVCGGSGQVGRAVAIPQEAPLETPQLDAGLVQTDYESLATELEHKSPLQVMDQACPLLCSVRHACWTGLALTRYVSQALSKFEGDVAIAFSGAEDVALVEYAYLTGRPFRIFRHDF